MSKKLTALLLALCLLLGTTAAFADGADQQRIRRQEAGSA